MEKATKTALVVLDNTVLTNYGLLRRTDLVAELWTRQVCTTPEVLAEYSAAFSLA